MTFWNIFPHKWAIPCRNVYSGICGQWRPRAVCHLIRAFLSANRIIGYVNGEQRPEPSCSKLTMSLVNDSLKFTSSDTHKYAEIFCWKNVSSFCIAKATHILSAKNIRILCIESTKTVNEMTLNKLVKLTTLWTTGPWMHMHRMSWICTFYTCSKARFC